MNSLIPKQTSCKTIKLIKFKLNQSVIHQAKKSFKIDCEKNKANQHI